MFSSTSITLLPGVREPIDHGLITTPTDTWFHPILIGADAKPRNWRLNRGPSLQRAGGLRSVAMKLTGHQTESVYSRYAIADERDLRVAVERLEMEASSSAG